LSGIVGWTTENALQVLPLLLHDSEQFESLSDLSKVSLPLVNLLIELLVEASSLET
jgi:hypothetical protein